MAFYQITQTQQELKFRRTKLIFKYLKINSWESFSTKQNTRNYVIKESILSDDAVDNFVMTDLTAREMTEIMK